MQCMKNWHNVIKHYFIMYFSYLRIISLLQKSPAFTEAVIAKSFLLSCTHNKIVDVRHHDPIHRYHQNVTICRLFENLIIQTVTFLLPQPDRMQQEASAYQK